MFLPLNPLTFRVEEHVHTTTWCPLPCLSISPLAGIRRAHNHGAWATFLQGCNRNPPTKPLGLNPHLEISVPSSRRDLSTVAKTFLSLRLLPTQGSRENSRNSLPYILYTQSLATTCSESIGTNLIMSLFMSVPKRQPEISRLLFYCHTLN